jgi:hypothetical protein
MTMKTNSISIRFVIVSLVVPSLLIWARPAHAIPSFARKYQTSCTTCHTIYPKLTPFGEAFRRNGFKFPGRDEDFIKQEMIPLGQPAYREVFPNAVWPGILGASSPLSFGGNGFVMFHPDNTSAAGRADNTSAFTLHDLVAEAHLWAGGSFSEHIAYFGEVTFNTQGQLDLEHLELHFNDLFGPKHLFNIYTGRGFSTLTSFGPHSSYLADTIMPGLSVTALYGATSDSFNTMGEYNLIEINGMAAGRFIYSIGINSGANLDVRTTENVYGHVGFKLGGMRLDGEGDTTGNPQKPWAENALTLDVFGIRSASHFSTMGPASAVPGVTPAAVTLDDETIVAGTHVRGQLGSLELNTGFYYEWHDHATPDNREVKAMAQYDELSYVVFPWLVPAFRIEYTSVAAKGDPRINDVKIIPGIAGLVRPNLKLVLLAQIEWADGAPPVGNWVPAGGFADKNGSVVEIETLQLNVAYAW